MAGPWVVSDGASILRRGDGCLASTASRRAVENAGGPYSLCTSGQQSVTRRNETRPARIDKTALLNDSYRLVAALGDQLHPRAGYRVEQSYELAILRQHLGQS